VPGSEGRPPVEQGAASVAEPTLDTTGHSPINIRNISIRCGRCNAYQTLSKFERRGEWNVYSYECENGVCDPAVTRTLIEVPAALDEFANRDPDWHGGKRHAGDHSHG
jgi:hypothetical protein